MLGIVEDDKLEVAPVKEIVKTDDGSLDGADSGISDENASEKPSDAHNEEMDCDPSDDDEPLVRRKTLKKSVLDLSDDDSCDVTEEKKADNTESIEQSQRKLTAEETLAQVMEEDPDNEVKDDSDDDDNIVLSAALSQKKKSRIKTGSFLGDNDEEDSRDQDNKGADNQGKMTFDSTIFDAETDSDEDNGRRSGSDSNDDSNRDERSGDEGYEDQDNHPISDKLKARLKKGAAKKPSTLQKKRAEKEQLQDLHSESQRHIRESRVSIPYHQPKPKSLSDFLNSAAQKQSALKTLKGAAGFRSISWYEEKEKEREKRRLEEKKRKSLAVAAKNEGSKPVDGDCIGEANKSMIVENPETSTSVQCADQTASGNKEIVPAVEEDFDTLPDLVVEMDTNNEKLNSEVTLAADDTDELPDLVSNPDKRIEGCESVPDSHPTVPSEESGVAETSKTTPSLDTSDIQLFEDPEEGVFASVISPDRCLGENRDSASAKPVGLGEADHKERNSTNSQLCDISGSPVACVEKQTSMTPSLKALSVSDLKTLTPKLSGSPNMVISLDDEDKQTPSNPGVVSLMSRFLQHSKKKKPQQSKDHNISIIQKETGVNEKEELKLTTVVYHTEQQEDSLSQCDKPGAKLLALKEQLSAQMRVKREEARQKRVELYQLDNEEGYEEGEGEEEAEMTDGSDTESEDGDYKPGDRVLGEEEDADQEANPFVDEEADVDDDYDEVDGGEGEDERSDDENAADVESDDENQSLKLALSDEEDTLKDEDRKEDEDMEEEVIKPCPKVKKSRALAFSDDEDSKDRPAGQEGDGVEDVNMTTDGECTEAKDISFGEDTMTPFTKHISMATQPESWICKAGTRPLSLPIEDSQDLYSNSVGDESTQHSQAGQSDSHSLHFLSEDTQSQMLDADGFLKVNSTLKKPKSKPVSLIRPSFEESTMDELLGLCSGRFTEQSQKPAEERKTSRSLFSQPETEDDNAQTGDMDELLGLCSGRFTDSTQLKFSQKRGIKRRPVDDDVDSDAESESSLQILSEDEDKENHDDKNELSSDEEDLLSEDDDTALMPAPKFKGFTVGSKKGAEKIRSEFVEDEAELSGSEYDSDENLDLPEEEDILMEEEGDKDVTISEEELRNQVGRVHMKKLMDQDHREMMRLQEMYLPDGDLHSEGKGRMRRFRWSNIDDTQDDMFGQGSDEEGAAEEEGEADSKWRMERHEREKWIKEQQEKEDAIGEDSNSQFVKFGKLVLKKKNKTVAEGESDSTVSNSADLPNESKKPNSKAPKLAVPSHINLSQKRGSFLSRGKDKLAKIAELTKSGVNTNAARTSHNFVFKPLSPDAEGRKTKGNSAPKPSYKIPSESQPPRAKRQKTVSDGSFSQNSIFNHFH